MERIAINAVMAGCLPTYMPLLIAGVHALADNPTTGMMAASTGSWSPFYLVNGPVRNDIHVNSSYGASSPGNIANAAIGRAMGLITKNIRGIRKQIEDMGVLGNPGKYSFVAAENEENSPWEPFHVERGFKKEDSTITVCFPQSYQQMVPFSTDDKGITRYRGRQHRAGAHGTVRSDINAEQRAVFSQTRLEQESGQGLYRQERPRPGGLLFPAGSGRQRAFRPG